MEAMVVLAPAIFGTVLQEKNWSELLLLCPDEGAQRLSETLLQHANCCIKKKRIVEKRSTHPWLNDTVLLAVADKRDAEGTPMDTEKAKTCINVVKEVYDK